MVLKQEPGYFDGIRDIIHSSVELSNEYQPLLAEDGFDMDYKLHLLGEDGFDMDYKLHLLDKDGFDADCELHQEGLAEEKNAESKRKQSAEAEEPDHSFCSEETDPDYEIFLQRLKENGKSYILQSHDYDENRKLIMYEGDSSSDTERDQELRRKPREMAFVKDQNSFDSQSTPTTDSKWSTRRRTRSQSRMEIERIAKRSSSKKDPDPEPERMLRSGRKLRTEQHFEDDSHSTSPKEMEKATMRSSRNKLRSVKEDDIIELDPDYYMFCQNLVVVSNHLYAYRDSTHEVMYEKGGESNQVRKEHNDEAYTDVEIYEGNRVKEVDNNGPDSDVEILDGPTFYKGNRVKEVDNNGPDSDVEILDGPTFYKNIESSTSHQEKSICASIFRQKVITALKKPFDEKELDDLRNAAEVRKPEERHIDLRFGRERSCAKPIVGKSYLDRYPAVGRKLLEVEDDKPKCLNLLRGFFLWLEQPYWFSPWLDDECLAIYPESG